MQHTPTHSHMTAWLVLLLPVCHHHAAALNTASDKHGPHVHTPQKQELVVLEPQDTGISHQGRAACDPFKKSGATI